MTPFYTGLPAQYYDYFFPEADEQELAYYHKHIIEAPGPALEIACGTGRILLALLERGLAVEGFDSSSEMLALCREKAQKKKLEPVLYQQTMHELALPKRYGCLYSPLGSFGMMADRAQAQQALKNFYDHLLPNGILLIYLHLPWHQAPEFGVWHEIEPRQISIDERIVVQEKAVHDPIEQLIYSTYRYQLYQGDALALQEEKELVTRWYSRYEFQMMLQQVGFDQITVSAGYEDQGPFDVMLFKAGKQH